ncbi:MAG: hypothetical protein IKD10_13090 [Lentisphaeria bacterium]|nr:hypothetical protein [Lentisphaeria bacterium]
MNIEEIVEYINRITPPRLMRFVSEKGENSCNDCLKYHLKYLRKMIKAVRNSPFTRIAAASMNILPTAK